MPSSTTADLSVLLPGTDRPLLTYYDDATGERTELSATDLGGWAARTAGLLRDDCGLQPGAHVGILLPPHWQTAAILLGAWSSGIAISFRSWARAGLQPAPERPLDAVFVSRKRLDSWLEEVPPSRHRYVLSLAADGARPDDVPAGYLDFVTEVLRHPETTPAYAAVTPEREASTDGTSYAEWGEIAHSIAASLTLRPGDRLLVDASEHEEPVQWLLAPLAAGASIVLCANLDRDRLDARIASEGVTRVI
jgi:uncharacterized protein (TIGR03089 family)